MMQTEIFVSPLGADTNSGTIDSPLASLSEAFFRCGAATENITVFLREGTYHVSDSLQLKSLKNITVRPYQEEVAILSGSVLLHSVPLSAEDKKYFANCAQLDQLREVDLSAASVSLQQDSFGMGISPAYGLPSVKQGNRFLELSRYPKKDYLYVKEAEKNSFLCEEAAQWKFDELWFFGYPIHFWADYAAPATVQGERIAVKEKANNYKTDRNSYYKDGQSYYLINIGDKLLPGEWVFSLRRNKIYFYAPEDGNDEVELSILQVPLLKLENCENIHFSHIIFEMTRGNGAENLGGYSNSFDQCEFRYISKTAVVFGSAERSAGCDFGDTGFLGNGGINCGVQDSYIHHIGMGGVNLSGGNRDELIPCRNFVKHCKIHTYSTLSKTYRPGISISGVGCWVVGNKIYDAPHMGLGFEGNEHLIEGNEIFNVCNYTDDAAAVYAGRDWSFTGNVFRNNYVHDIPAGIADHGTYALYMDDCSGSVEICGNVFEHTSYSIMLHGGRNINCHHNVFRDCLGAFRLVHHHPLLVDKHQPFLKERLAKFDLSKPGWAKYPYLRTILEDRPTEPCYNRVVYNLLIHTPLGKIAPEVVNNGEVHDNNEI